MRLPALTKGQKLNEDSRQLNERLYQAYLEHGAVEISATAATLAQRQMELSANGKRFWNMRGFHFKTRLDRARLVVRVWLEPVTAENPRRTRQRCVGNEAWQMAGATKVGPTVACECVDCGFKSERRRAWDTFSLGECRECGGEMKPRPKTQALRADAKAKRELAEQEVA